MSTRGQAALQVAHRMPWLTKAYVGAVRLEMSGRGFALLDTPAFFDDDLSLECIPRKAVLTFNCKGWWKFPQLAGYCCWLERVLDEALPDEPVSFVALEFRRERSGCPDPEVDRLHADGSYVRSVYTLAGPTTIYRDEKAERAVLDGQTLLMTAMGRARAVGVPCTLHRRPGAGPARALIVCSFEPCRERLPFANVYREVAQIHRRGRR